MSKSRIDKKVNRIARELNKKLAADVFGDRFWIRQVQKARSEGGSQYYLYEMRDRLEPNRNSVIAKGWLLGDSRFITSDLYEAINDFIVKSDFWSIYHNRPESYDMKQDEYAHEFYHYHSRRVL